MNSKLWIRKALSLCLSVAILATYSMVALAAPGKAAGELTVSGKNINGETPFVFVNGDTARSGRSVFSGSTITTPETASAVLNLGKFGKIELAPATSLTLTFDNKGIFGDLTSGKVTVLGANDSVAIKTINGKTVQVAAGQSVSASGKAQDDDDDDDHDGSGWWIWAAIFGGAAVGLVWTALSDSDIQVGSGGTVISPIR
ncbi:MAG TPA: hypothetical protein VJV05_17205 [Pyrinomonadaceae bacterium]|nr:hypothetical protein [Pyrinomonadaceae bacterium]